MSGSELHRLSYRMYQAGAMTYMVDLYMVRRVEIIDVTIFVARDGKMCSKGNADVLYGVKVADDIDEPIVWQPTGDLLFAEREAAEAEFKRRISLNH